MAKRESLPGISPAKKEYGIEAGQIKCRIYKNVWLGYGQQAAGVLQRILKKNHGFSARCPAYFFQKLNMSAKRCINQMLHSTKCRFDKIVFDQMSWIHLEACDKVCVWEQCGL